MNGVCGFVNDKKQTINNMPGWAWCLRQLASVLEVSLTITGN